MYLPSKIHRQSHTTTKYRHYNTENSELNINLNRKHFSACKQYLYIVQRIYRVKNACIQIALTFRWAPKIIIYIQHN